MGKFRSKVNFKNEKNAGFLIKAFFQDFNEESSISIKGKEANMEIVFIEPPMSIIDALGYCEVIEFDYGKSLKEHGEDEVGAPENPEKFEPETGGEGKTENLEPEAGEEGELENLEPETGEAEKPENLGTGKKRGKENPVLDIPELKEIAKKASSFENFVKLVAQWLEMDKRQEFFEKLEIAATEVEKLSWKELEKALKQKGIIYGAWDKIWCSKKVSEKLQKDSITILPLLNEIAQYKEYPFKQLEDEVLSEEIHKLEGGIKPRVKMNCMPEIKHFEEILASVDMTKSVEERLRYVLEAMGLRKKSAQAQEWILEMANTALKKGKIAFDIIFVETNIPMENSIEAKMEFSSFINEFAKKHQKECKNIKLLTFLTELQKIIMLESEIESFSDFDE